MEWKNAGCTLRRALHALDVVDATFDEGMLHRGVEIPIDRQGQGTLHTQFSRPLPRAHHENVRMSRTEGQKSE